MDAQAAIAFEGGETAALQRLKHYLWDTGSISTYFDTRNGMLGADYSTKFSPWLARGCISPRTIFQEVCSALVSNTQCRCRHANAISALICNPSVSDFLLGCLPSCVVLHY